jgi:hypothetical protein
MTATNHALTGALVGLTVHNPWIALPAALLSHFVLDAIPHYDFPGDELSRLRSKGFLYIQICANAVLCLALVALLSWQQPANWFLAALCAFVAALPDAFSLPKYLYAKRQNTVVHSKNALQRFHQTKLQWKAEPGFWWLEVLWFAGASVLLWQFL